MSTYERCTGVYRQAWDSVTRCELRRSHKGSCGPAKPALAQEHSPTSRAAAAAIEPTRMPLRMKVLVLLRERRPDGLTDEEIQERLAMPSSTERPRRVELVEAGLVRDSHRTRPTKAGRAAVVWIAA